MINSLRIFFRDLPNGLVVRPKVESPHLAVGGFEPTSVLQPGPNAKTSDRIEASQTNPRSRIWAFSAAAARILPTGAEVGLFRPLSWGESFSELDLGTSRQPVDFTLSPR